MRFPIQPSTRSPRQPWLFRGREQAARAKALLKLQEAADRRAVAALKATGPFVRPGPCSPAFSSSGDEETAGSRKQDVQAKGTKPWITLSVL